MLARLDSLVLGVVLSVTAACVGDTTDLDRAPEAPEGLAFRFEGPIESLVFAPGGRWLAVEEGRADDASRLWLVDVEERRREVATETFVWPLRFSRGAEVLVYVDVADGPRAVLRDLEAGDRQVLPAPGEVDGFRFGFTQRHLIVSGGNFGPAPVALYGLDGVPVQLDERWGPLEGLIDFEGSGAAFQPPGDRAPFVALFDDEAGAFVQTLAQQRAERWVDAGLLLSSPRMAGGPTDGLVLRARDGRTRTVERERVGDRTLDARTLCVWDRGAFELRAKRFRDLETMEATLTDDPLQVRAVGGLCVAQLEDAVVIVDPERRVVDRVEGRSEIGDVAFLDTDAGAVLALGPVTEAGAACGARTPRLVVYDGTVDPPMTGGGPFVAGDRLHLFACADGRRALHRWSPGDPAPALVSRDIPPQPGFVAPGRTRAVYFDRVAVPTIDNPNGFIAARPWRVALGPGDSELRPVSARPRDVRELALSDTHLALATADDAGWLLEILDL